MKQSQLTKNGDAATTAPRSNASMRLSYREREFISWKKQIARQLTTDMGCTRLAGDYLSNTQFALVAWRSGLSVGETADFLYEANRDLCDSLASDERRAIVGSISPDSQFLRMILGDGAQKNQ